jgi:hypothetical protein
MPDVKDQATERHTRQPRALQRRSEGTSVARGSLIAYARAPGRASAILPPRSVNRLRLPAGAAWRSTGQAQLPPPCTDCGIRD